MALLRIAELESDLENAAVERVADEGPADREPTEPAWPPKAKAKGQSTGKHGGWMPQIAHLICSIKSSDWVYMQKLIDRFMSGSDALSKLVQQKLKIKKGKDNGKGSHSEDVTDDDAAE